VQQIMAETNTKIIVQRYEKLAGKYTIIIRDVILYNHLIT
jgi:hypothetical protein